MWGERGYSDGSTPRCDSAVSACFSGCLTFLPRHFSHSLLPHIPSLPQSLSPQSTAALALGLLYNPSTPAPSHCIFQGTCIPVQGTYGCSKDSLILIPFSLLQISCFTLSLNCFSSDSDNCPDVRMSSPTCQGQVQSY